MVTPNKRSKNTPNEIWSKKVPNLSYLKVWGGRAVVRLIKPKRKTLGERESNDSMSMSTIIESRDTIFDKEIFTYIPRPSKNTTQAEDVYGGISSMHELRNGTRARKAKSFGSDFQLYLVEGTRDETMSQHQYCFNIEDDPKNFSEAMTSRDVYLWKEVIHDDIDFVIYVIQGFRQKEGIDFFDTYAPVSRISTIRLLLLSLAAIHNIVIHQMDVKTTFLNGDLDEENYMKQPEGFVMARNKHKVCKLKKSLYGLKQAPKQRHQ
uniref:Reverse transcriptase Ty1/copia-type domain-containing protein n=1 Tax=Lactuca sativa TaxID=4236 RepID=A0A9R1VJN3_LACSA|nr:hypothetical protein LSAT_V11C500272420 [Lactuca sativa]